MDMLVAGKVFRRGRPSGLWWTFFRVGRRSAAERDHGGRVKAAQAPKPRRGDDTGADGWTVAVQLWVVISTSIGPMRDWSSRSLERRCNGCQGRRDGS